MQVHRGSGSRQRGICNVAALPRVFWAFLLGVLGNNKAAWAEDSEKTESRRNGRPLAQLSKLSKLPLAAPHASPAAPSHVIERVKRNDSHSGGGEKAGSSSRLHADSVGHLVEVAETGKATLIDARTAASSWLSEKEAEVRTLTTGAKRMRDARLELEREITAISKISAKDPTAPEPTKWRPTGSASLPTTFSTAGDLREAAGQRSLMRRDSRDVATVFSSAAKTAGSAAHAARAVARHDRSAAADPACCNTADWVDFVGRGCDWYGDNLQSCDSEARIACCICHLGRRPDQSCGLGGASSR